MDRSRDEQLDEVQEFRNGYRLCHEAVTSARARHKEFCTAIEHGKIQADAEIAESLYNRARGYKHEATKIFMPAGAAAPVYAPYTEYYPPDTQAASLWLRNRQPAKWRDRQQADMGGSIEHRVATMTPDERAAAPSRWSSGCAPG